MITRRRLLAGLASAALFPPAPARAQSVRIGMLPLGSPASAYDQSLVEAFRQGLRDAGMIEGRHIELEVAWIAREPDTYPVVDGLLARGVKLLIPCGSSASAASLRQTKTVPIVFISVGNPVGIGLVKSLSHPGGNVTGFSDMLAELSGKYVEIARELGRPGAPVDYLWHTLWPDGQYRFKATERAATSLGVKLRPRGIGDIDEVKHVMAAMKSESAGAVVVQPSPFTFRERHRIVEAATSHGLGTIFPFPAAAADGATISFGPDYVHMYRRVGVYVDRILRGEKPAHLPVQQPTKFDLIVNLKAAAAVGLPIPQPLLQRADQIIQ